MKLIFQINKMLVVKHHPKFKDHKRAGHIIYYNGNIQVVCVYKPDGYYNPEKEHKQIHFKELV